MKECKKVLLKNLNKIDCTLVKFYQVISPLNYLGQLIAKLVAKKLLQFCEPNEKLHKSQIKAWKNW